MDVNLRHDVNFQGIFKKLGHSLEEIRVRALENLLSKLEHKLICDADLINERHLFIRLLEWFNFEGTTRQGDVLHLLLRLSQHSPAAEILQDIGSIEFLSHLRSDVSSSLQPIIDQILENTMRLPEVKPVDNTPTCVYHRQGDVTDPKLHMDSSGETLQSHMSSPSVPPQIQQETSHMATGRDGADGYFSKEAIEAVQQHQTDQWTGVTSSFYVTTFPWLALTPTDRHVIHSTNSSLQSRESHLLASSCEFLSDVVFQDFPAEIFLQRPNIVKNLLAILGSTNTQLTVKAARTLGDLTSYLKSRLRYYQDPALFTPKQDFNSTSASPFTSPSTLSNQSNQSDGGSSLTGWTDTRHRGDGRDGDSSSSSSASMSRASSVGLGPDLTNQEETDIEDMQALQSIQLTLPHFCMIVMEKALPLLKTGDEGLVVQLLYLLNEVLCILVSVVTPEVWQDASSPARDVVDRMINSFELINELIQYHHHGDGRHGNSNHEKDKGDLVQHRLAYIGVAGFLAQFLKQLAPIQTAKSLLPGSLAKSLEILVFDEGLSHSYPDIQIILLAYLQQLGAEKYKIYTETAKVCQSMQKTCKFLMLCQEEAYKGSSELITIAEESICSLPYHLHLPLVSEFVKLSSSVCARATEEKVLQSKCRGILLKFLSHPLPKVRQQTYNTAIQVVKGSLSVNEASDPSSRACFLSRFLFSSEILYEIVVFGLCDKDTKVSQTASDLMTHLLDSQFFMTEDLWQELLNNLLKSLPILQTFVDVGSPLGACLLSMTDPLAKYNSGALPHLEKLRGTLRMMFSTDVRTRAEALKRLAWFLSNEERSATKLPVFASLDVTNLTNIFVIETPRSVDEDLGRSVFQTDGLRKVYDIFKSKSVDPSVKKSAIDQLAIILQDHNLHAAFKTEGGPDGILEHIRDGLFRTDDTVNANQAYLPACVAILRYLVHHDYSMRHRLAYDVNIYLSLLRVAFLYQKDERTCYEVAHIFALLLFDEVAKFDLGGGTNPITYFSIPEILKKRLRLPFRPSCHHDNSPNQIAIPPDSDPLRSGLPAYMLKTAWNVAWHNGMEKLLKYLAKSKLKQDSPEEFSALLRLSCTDRQILQASHLMDGLQQAVFDISNATSHKAVSHALQRILSYLMTTYGYVQPEILFKMDWFTSIGRFLKVQPSLTDDEALLQEVLRFISMALRLSDQVPENTLQWLGEMLYQPSGPLIGLSHRTSVIGETRDVPENVNIKRTLDKELLSFISTYNSKLPYLLCRRLKIQQLRGDLTHQLLQRLNVTDAPHFYNLASLEGTLKCLMHVTARPGWSQESTDLESSTLRSKLLNCLLEVVSAFHIGRGGTSMSYMGKGVTKAATLCLCHLGHEMATISEDKEWPQQWSYVQQRPAGQTPVSEITDHGLNWMLTLWAYRDPEVRAAGLSIAVALTSTESGRIIMASQCKHIPGSIWGATFSILLDQSECSMVRQQAALLLVNLTSQTMPCGSVELENNIWQGPIVTDTNFEVSLVGLTALLALLHHSQFYQEILVVFSNFYAQPTVQPSIVTDLALSHMSSVSSESTASTTTDFISVSQQNSGTQFHTARASTGRLRVSGQSPKSHRLQKSPQNASLQPAESSGSTTVAMEAAGYQSVATPSLVSAISQLLRNLVILAPQDTFTCMKRESFIQIFMNMVDTNLLEAYMTEMEGLTSCDQYELVFCELLQMYSSILNLLRACIVYDTPIRQEILDNSNFLTSTFALITISFKGSSDVMSKLHDLWRSVLQFYTVALQLQGASALHVLTTAIQKLWPSLSENLTTILKERMHNKRDLYVACVQFLSILLCEEGKLQGRQPELSSETLTITQLLDAAEKTGKRETDEVSSGSSLCQALIGVHDQVITKSADHKNSDRLHVVAALRHLLAISDTAKAKALDMGLVESLIEHIKETHSKINMESLRVGKSTHRKKEDPLIQDLILTFDLLQNLLYRSEEAKMASYHSGLHNVIHRLWSWCQMEPQLMIAALSLLSTYVAKCTTATSSLAYSSSSQPSQQANSKSGQQLSNNCLVHCLIKLAGREGNKDNLLRILFGLLATLTLSSECRNIIFKGNFLREFTELNPRKTKKTKQKQNMEIYWLELLVNLSFSTEGQQMILKTGDSVDLLLDFVECGQGRTQECALLIIRNLCCHGSSKPKLLANEKLLPFLLQCLDNPSQRLPTLAASALWALVFNNQKAKVIMKNANVLPKLQEIQKDLRNANRISNKCVEDLDSVIVAILE